MLVNRYKEDAGVRRDAKLKCWDTPGYDEEYNGLDAYEKQPGAMESTCRKHVGGLLFLVRCTRAELMVSTIIVSREVDSWNKASDKRLERIMGYLEHNADLSLKMGFDARERDQLRMVGYVDSGHAGDRKSRKSIGGAVAILDAGFNSSTFAMVDWNAKSQKAPDTSTGAVETIAISHGMQRTIVPTSHMMDQMVGHVLPCDVYMDNDASLKAILKGGSVALSYLRKFQDTSLKQLHMMFTGQNVPDHSTVMEDFSEQCYHRIMKAKGFTLLDNDPRRAPIATLAHVDSECNVSDAFTKPIEKVTFLRLRSWMGVLETGRQVRYFRVRTIKKDEIEVTAVMGKQMNFTKRIGLL